MCAGPLSSDWTDDRVHDVRAVSGQLNTDISQLRPLMEDAKVLAYAVAIHWTEVADHLLNNVNQVIKSQRRTWHRRER